MPLHHVSHSFSIVTLFLHAQVERIKRESPHGQQKGWALRGLIVKSGDDCRQVRLEGVHSHMHPFIVTCTHPFIVNSRDDCRQVRLERVQSHAARVWGCGGECRCAGVGVGVCGGKRVCSF